MGVSQGWVDQCYLGMLTTESSESSVPTVNTKHDMSYKNSMLWNFQNNEISLNF